MKPLSPPEILHPVLAKSEGKAYLVGAGPGDPMLLTLKAKWVLENADVILYDYLVDTRIMQMANPNAEWIYVGKSGLTGHTLSQEGIENLIVEQCKTGKMLCRLKGGDPYVFGRGGEEGQTLYKHGIPFEVVPGISSAIAVPNYAGIPVTHRDHVSAVTILTGHEDPTKPESSLNWSAIANTPGTLIFLMGVKQLGEICQKLITNGKSAKTPIALVEWGTRPNQRSIRGTLENIAERVAQQQFKPPCVTIIGDVVGLQDELNWFEKLPLFGKTIVITRAREQASTLRQQLELLGANVIEFPTIRIRANTNSSELKPYLDQVQSYDWLIFTSPNAVTLFQKALLENQQDWRVLGKAKIAVIGPATRDVLMQAGIQADLLPGKFVAESLFASLEKAESLNGKRVLMPRADIARDYLPNALRNAGAIVDDIPLYFTELPTDGEDIQTLVDALENNAVDVITFSSSSTADNFAKRLAPALEKNPNLLDSCKLASIGPITSETIKKQFGRVDIEASIYTIDGLLSAILYAEDESQQQKVEALCS